MKHIVFFSSGIGSWACAKRVAEQHGVDDLILLFADTGIEDEDNYRFLEDAARNVGGELIKVRSSRNKDVFENWRSRRAIANNRMPFCSFDLKHKPCRDWLKTNSTIEDIFYVGISWDEIHRLPAIEKGWFPNKVVAPLTEPPYFDRNQLLNWAANESLDPPRLYALGFAHSNCGGGCVRAGQAQWRHLLKTLPDVFARWESEEESMRQFLGRDDIAILKRQKDNVVVPYPLSELRKDAEQNGQLDLFDWGGCGCFSLQEDAA